MTRHFASDNFSGVHPTIMKALTAANGGHVKAYGDDAYTEAAKALFRQHFGEQVEVFFVFGGTGANVVGLQALTNSYHGIICADCAHVNVDECGAPEKFTGCKLLTVPSPDGKITPEQIAHFLHFQDVEHHSQPRVVSITQATEFGTVYTPEEIKAIATFAHKHDMLLHMDGARLANAAVSLGVDLRDITADMGVDVLSCGGTKNGMMFGEAVVFFHPEQAQHVKFIRKQSMQLYSKMRFIAAQFEAYLSEDLWRTNAQHANDMAQFLAQELSAIPGIRITQKVEANAVFAIVPKDAIPLVQEKCYFYIWNEEISEVRLMTSFDTTKKDVNTLISALKKALP
jgi:threonine aldolase